MSYETSVEQVAEEIVATGRKTHDELTEEADKRASWSRWVVERAEEVLQTSKRVPSDDECAGLFGVSDKDWQLPEKVKAQIAYTRDIVAKCEEMLARE